MALLDYTTFEDVRAALGVSPDEIEDSTLSLSLYEFSLSAAIRAVSAGLTADFATVDAKVPNTLTSIEEILIECMTLFATYAVARELLTSLPLFSPKEITDGKAAVTRYSINPYKDTMARVEAQYTRYRDALVTAYADYKSTSTTTNVAPVLLFVGQPSFDPVTGS